MKKFFTYLFLILLSTTACTDKKNSGLGGETYIEEYEKGPTWEELYADTIAEKEHVGKECAVVCNNLDIARDRLQNVLSPQALINAKKMYLQANINLTEDIKGLTAEEKALVETYKDEADKAYRKACRSYEVPSSGVIANLNDYLKAIDKVQTKQDLIHYEEGRLGVLRNLDNIHLCVVQTDRNIPEVKRLAMTLKSKYETKQHELGMK